MTFDPNLVRRSGYVSYRRRQQRRKKIMMITLVIVFLLVILAGIGIGLFLRGKDSDDPQAVVQEHVKPSPQETAQAQKPVQQQTDAAEEISIQLQVDPQADAAASGLQLVLEEAEALALTYDYDAAIELLNSDPDYASATAVQDKIKEYEEIRSTLVRVDPGEITHVFFHSLIIDNAKAFDGDADTDGYNQVMTTSREFTAILEQMYERGYVLVKMHDIAYETTDENGKTVFTPGNIMLPPGKKAFVMSQDDVCYYDYMEGDGFASRMVIGEDGKPTCEMIMDDGSVSTGPYDLVPILEDFIKEHPDFSYKGARAVLAFTGYQGVLGYRTDPAYKDSNPNYEEDCETVRQVAQCLRDNGWELASHSWGHINMTTRDFNSVKTDADKWESRVESLIGETDIIIYPFGADIGDWRPYTTANDKFNYLYKLGFRYFCNVDGSPYWVQIQDKFMRQGRRNLDGYRMYYDLPETNPRKTYLDDLFDVETVFDPDRPKPVPMM